MSRRRGLAAGQVPLRLFMCADHPSEQLDDDETSRSQNMCYDIAQCNRPVPFMEEVDDEQGRIDQKTHYRRGGARL
jgi:hypothetical protein